MDFLQEGMKPQNWKVEVDTTVKPHTVCAKYLNENEGEECYGTTSGYFIEYVHGVAYHALCNQERWDHLNSLVKYRNNDVFIASYTKCGTTLVEQILLLLLHAKIDESGFTLPNLNPGTRNAYHPISLPAGKIWIEACVDRVDGSNIPGPEFTPLCWEEFNSAPSPRVFKTHAPVQLLLGTNVDTLKDRVGYRGVEGLPAGAKVLIACRNPLDACVSRYYHGFNPFKNGWPFEGNRNKH